MQVTVDIPEELARRLGGDRELSQRVKEAILIDAYLAGDLSRRQVGALLEFSYHQTEAWFDRRGILRDYRTSDLEADRDALDRLLPDR
jgi:predicted HTH domain antitoxin